MRQQAGPFPFDCPFTPPRPECKRGSIAPCLTSHRAYEALPPGGVLIAVDNLIDDRRRTATLPLAMSLTMLLEFGEEDAFDYSFKEFRGWAMQVRWTGCRRVCNSYSYQQGLGNAGVKVDCVCVSWAGMSDAGALGWVQVRWACKCTGLGILLPPPAPGYNLP